jgi:hypothetical protein
LFLFPFFFKKLTFRFCKKIKKDFAIEYPQQLQGIIPVSPLIIGSGSKDSAEDKATNLFSEVFSSTNPARFLTKDIVFASTLNKDTLNFYDYELQTVKEVFFICFIFFFFYFLIFYYFFLSKIQYLGYKSFSNDYG